MSVKQKNKFKITIPKYDYYLKDNDVPRLNCLIEIFINKNFVIYIIIDSLIRPNLNIVKMYDFYYKTYVENESVIYLNETSKNIFKKENRDIQLSLFYILQWKIPNLK